MPLQPLCCECVKFLEDWYNAVKELSRRSVVYSASAVALDTAVHSEQAMRIEGANLRADVALAMLHAHRQIHEPLCEAPALTTTADCKFR